MTGTNFTEIAARYERDSLIQKSAAERLIGLLDIRQSDDVLDLGCGTGNLARRIRLLTHGRVLGVDPSIGMILEAEANRQGLDISYDVQSAATLPYQNRFSVIFCNSAFQWFREPGHALSRCYQALSPGGRMGIQAPARRAYCPTFLKAIDRAAKDRRTAAVFSSFRTPWFFCDSAEEYGALFRKAGFDVPFATIEEQRTFHTPDQVMTIFETGAAAGYLNQHYYEAVIDDAYSTAFREMVKESFHSQANEQGLVELVFYRIYLLAVKESGSKAADGKT
jgi:trans-aconitate methyltransferase